MNKISIHPDFTINRQSFDTSADLISYVSQFDRQSAVFLTDIFNDKHTITAYTSGSTGIPKQILLEKKALINSALKTIHFFDLRPGTRALINLSTDFIAGKMMWIRAIIGGWHITLVSPDHKSVQKVLSQQTFDFGAMVPLQVYQNLEHITSIRQLIIGGGAVSETLLNKLKNLPNKIFATYGMTETITHIAVKPLNKAANSNFYTTKEQSNSYKLLKDISISQDERGCLVINAPEISKNQIVTNDIVEIIDSQHFKWLGRYDNIINSGGVKIIPEQVEQKLMTAISLPFVISSIADDKFGEILVLVIESKEFLFDLDSIKAKLSKFEIPKKVIFVSEFPRTNSGKIKRKELKKLLVIE